MSQSSTPTTAETKSSSPAAPLNEHVSTTTTTIDYRKTREQRLGQLMMALPSEKILKQCHPDYRLSQDATKHLLHLLNLTMEIIFTQDSMKRFLSVPTLDELMESCRHVLPSELAEQAVDEAQRAKDGTTPTGGLQYDIPLLVIQQIRPVVLFSKPYPDDLRHCVSAVLEAVTARVCAVAGDELKRGVDDQSGLSRKTKKKTKKKIVLAKHGVMLNKDITMVHIKTAMSQDKELKELMVRVDSYCESEETKETTTDDLLTATSETILKSMATVMTNWPVLLELMSKQRGEMLELKVATEVELEAKRENFERNLKRERMQLDKEVSAFEDNIQKWNDDQETFKKTYQFKNKIIRLNVGGQLMSTKLATLQEAGGYLSSLFSGRFEPDYDDTGAVFLDLDGDHFKEILDLLRHQGVDLKKPLPMYLKNACKYLQIGSQWLFLDETFEPEKQVVLGSAALVGDGTVDFELPKELGEHVCVKNNEKWPRCKERPGFFSDRDILDGSVKFHAYDGQPVVTFKITQEPSKENDNRGLFSKDSEDWTFRLLSHPAEVCKITLSTITCSVEINEEKKTVNCKLGWD